MNLHTLVNSLLLGALFATTVVARDDAPAPLGESDLFELIEREANGEAVLRKIREAKLGFEVNDAVLKRLEEAGVSKAVLEALAAGESFVHEAYDSTTMGALTVEGTGGTSFQVRQGENVVKIGTTGAERTLELAAGAYRVFLNGFELPVVVETGRRTIVATGEVTVLAVPGIKDTDKGFWSSRSPTRAYSAADKTSKDGPSELFVGTWYVKPGSTFRHEATERRVVVESGKHRKLRTGAILPTVGTGTLAIFLGEQRLTIDDVRGDVVHLFPGTYELKEFPPGKGQFEPRREFEVKAGELIKP